jgi:hypothetical protein
METEPINVVGKIYSRDAAESTYGSVIAELKINSSVLASLAASSGAYIMFHMNDGKLIISDQDKKPLHPPSEEFPEETVFHYFSTSKVNELLKSGNDPSTSIEQRRDVLTLSSGNFTLENSRPCPPYCP